MVLEIVTQNFTLNRSMSKDNLANRIKHVWRNIQTVRETRILCPRRIFDDGNNSYSPKKSNNLEWYQKFWNTSNWSWGRMQISWSIMQTRPTWWSWQTGGTLQGRIRLSKLGATQSIFQKLNICPMNFQSAACWKQNIQLKSKLTRTLKEGGGGNVSFRTRLIITKGMIMSKLSYFPA